MKIHRLFVVLATLAAAPHANGASILQSYLVNADIPDDTLAGFHDVQTLSLADSTITDISINLRITPAPGGEAFLGDLYAFVQHGDNIVVLLNRPGRRAGYSAGYDENQILNVTFDAASPNIHSYRASDDIPLSGALIGHWSPDARAAHPLSVLDTDVPTLGLDSLMGASANGAWTLFVSDLSSGGEHRFVSWGLDLQTAAVPDGGISTAIAGALWAALTLMIRRRR